MIDHKATSEQWADAGAFASGTRACLLELRGRVEDLEIDVAKEFWQSRSHLDFIIERLEKLEAASTSTSQEDYDG
jgi:BMFP domain-containing protein YqiC